jgi:hypothetical protein
VTLRSTTDNTLAVSSPIVLTLKGELQYGTATATTHATFIVVENPCLKVVIPNPPATAVTYDFTLSSFSSSITIDHATLLPGLVNYLVAPYECVTFALDASSYGSFPSSLFGPLNGYTITYNGGG